MDKQDGNDEIIDEIRDLYGPGLEEEFGHVDESIIEKITSIYTDPESWTETEIDE